MSSGLAAVAAVAAAGAPLELLLLLTLIVPEPLTVRCCRQDLPSQDFEAPPPPETLTLPPEQCNAPVKTTSVGLTQTSLDPVTSKEM